MNTFIIQTLKVFVALFIITDSVGNLPIFMSLTEGSNTKERRKIFSAALVTGLLLLAFFAFAGVAVFSLFDITIDDLKIAGGILLLIVSIELMMKGRVNFGHKEEMGVVPLGCPLLVGPGAITTILVMVNLYNIYAVILGTAVCFVSIWVVLFFSDSLYRFFGRNGALIITKISSIIIAAIAVRFIRQAVQVLFHL